MTLDPTTAQDAAAQDRTVAPVLTVSDLAVTFNDAGGQVEAVRGTSWSLRPGRITALVGESGSGKSVSAMSVLGLLPATATVTGSIQYRSGEGDSSLRPHSGQLVDADDKTFRHIRGQIFSLVSQEPMSAWNPVLTIGSQVSEAITAHQRLPRTAVRQRMHDLFRDAGLTEPARIAASYPHQLSGGQLQRALIAMALSQNPIAVVADEPTTALDVTVQAQILQVLRRLRDERGTAVLLITHDMGVVADLADDVVVMKDGLIVEQAPVAELFADPHHAYTRELLAAVPRLSVTQAEARDVEFADRERPDSTPTVNLAEVSMTFPGRHGSPPVQAVRQVNLSIHPGEVLGLVGESGSGKSTLSQLVTGLLVPTSGVVSVAGIDLAKASRSQRAQRRASTGIVFQDPASTLNPRWSVARSIAEPLRLHTDLTETARRQRVLDLLQQVRLPTQVADRYPHELSGGQRQRIAIARAVALRPTLLVADEPTSALDVSVQAHVLEVFADLQQDLGFACLFVSHNLAVVEQVADRVAVMKSGEILEQGDAAQVLVHPTASYTKELLAAAPVPDPGLQAERRLLRAGERPS